MENQNNQGHDLKDIQDHAPNQADGIPGTSLAEATAMNKNEADQNQESPDGRPAGDQHRDQGLDKRPDDIENAVGDKERMGNNGL